MSNAVDIAITLAKRFEGLELSPYSDVGGVATIGYGTTYYLDGRKVSMNDPPITENMADELLSKRMSDLEQDVLGLLPKLNGLDNKLAAVLDFAYNVGFGALACSTLANRIEKGDFEDAALEFPKWNKAVGRVCKGLVARRQAELDLFLT